MSCASAPGVGDAPGEAVFDVSVFGNGVGPLDNQAFSLLAF